MRAKEININIEDKTSEQQLYEFYKPEFDIYEGLITSHALYHVEKILKNLNYDIKPNFKFNTFSLRYVFDEDYNVAEGEINKILRLTDNLGWFPTSFSSYKDDGSFKQDKWSDEKEHFKSFIINGFKNILFSFEAKFDILQERFPRFLYHVCNEIVTDKILKHGLTPKSRSKKAFHPERVYLSKTLNDAYNYVYKKYEIDKIKDLAILKIDTLSIDYYLKLYRDPNYIGQAFYTLNHITPYCLSVYEYIHF